MADRVMTQNAAAAFLAKRPAVVSRSDAPPTPQCSDCGSFLAADAQYAPATYPSCGVVLPDDPDKAAKGRVPGKRKAPARPWRVDRVWIEAFCDSVARHTKALLDVRDKQIAELQRDIEALKTKRAKRVPK
jgi:hypothetical protein